MSLIHIPWRDKKIIVDEPIILPYRVRGLYRCRVYGPDRDLRKDTGWFPNLITNQGLDYIGTTFLYLSYCAVGTGNGAPAFTDTVLNAQIASQFNAGGSSPNNGNGGSNPNFYGYLNMFYNFGQGAAAGNLQEIGIGIDTTTHLFSRALILNNVGAPTTLTVLANEYLSVSYQLQLYNATTDVSGSVNVSGTVCPYTLRAANCGSSSWTMGGFNAYPERAGLRRCTVYNDTVLQPITSGPIGASQGFNDNGWALGGYTPGNYYIDSTANFSFSQCNGGANNSALCTFGQNDQGFGSCQIIFGATIPKTASQIMTLTFRQTWGRYP